MVTVSAERRPMEFTPLSIPEVVMITPRIFQDNRGYFLETYKTSLFKAHGIPMAFVQDNLSMSYRNVLRGLHYQLNPHAQGKLVQCLVGKIYDVAVDIRQGSPTFGQWVSACLDDQSRQMLYVPEGFAHGFVVLSDTAVVQYKVTAEYAPQSDSGIRWNDPDLAIDWGIEDPIVSEKDQKLPFFNEAEHNFIYQPQSVSL